MGGCYSQFEALLGNPSSRLSLSISLFVRLAVRHYKWVVLIPSGCLNAEEISQLWPYNYSSFLYRRRRKPWLLDFKALIVNREEGGLH